MFNLPFCCHPGQCSYSQSTVYLLGHQTPPIYGLVCLLMQTHEMCWPQSHQSTRYEENLKIRRQGGSEGNIMSQVYINTLKPKRYEWVQGIGKPHEKLGQIDQRAVPWWWTLGSVSWRWPSPPHRTLSHSWDTECLLVHVALWSSQQRALPPAWS